MTSTLNHITVCICTYKRPLLLKNLLEKLQTQKTEGLFNYSVLVVDNDFNQTARPTVDLLKGKAKISHEYFVEPEKNIALARNKAVENAKGDLVAFIDDDEYPVDDWLLNLYKASIDFKADGVLGPVKPRFESEPPQWVINGGFCERESFETGFNIKSHKYTRTGNVLLNKMIFDEGKELFDPAFGRTGGEDVNFFKRIIKRGRVVVWCNEAVVYEVVPPQRISRSYFLKRALLRGTANSEKATFLSYEVFKSIIAAVLYTSVLPVALLLRHDLIMKYLVRDCDHLGKLLGLCGLKIVKEKTF